MATGQDLVNKMMTQVGKRYIFGFEVNLNDRNPRAFDCSEIIEWALYQLGVRFPDGSSAQIAATNKISVAQGLKTPGALLYKPGHIAVSRGDNTTIEAKGRNYGVGVFSAVNRFTRAGLVPQLAYGAPSGVVTSGVSAPAPVNLAAIAAGVAAAKRSVLRLGSRGNDVIWLQVGINNLSGRGLQTDGVFGESTLAAVLDLQRWFGLPQDGVVGARTWGVVYP